MPNLSECRKIVRQLWPFLDGVLPDALKEEVAEHLEACANCRSHFDFERAFLEAVRTHGAISVDGQYEALRARVLSALVTDGFTAR